MTKKKAIQVLKNGGIFIALMMLTFYIVFKDNSLQEMNRAIEGVQGKYLLVGVAAMMAFLSCEALNIIRILRVFSYKIGMRQGLKYALTGFFFSAVTPSASGGQPMQLYAMHKDQIKASHGTLALLFELLSFEIVTVSLAIIGFFYQREEIAHAMGNLQYLLLIGIGLNTIVMILLILAIFSKKTIALLLNIVVKLTYLFSPQKAEKLRGSLDRQISDYQASAGYFKANKMIFAKTIGTTLIQILAMYCVPFLVYKGFGLDTFHLGEVLALQAVLYVSVSALPLPGALGVCESGFMLLFKTLFPAGILPGAMVLSRGISFYLFVLISGLCVAGFTLFRRKEVCYGIYNTDCGG
ncbi:MAG: lysylphosphatidylglycerol synthase transmembrane domain-containing protein [Emergencia sp.]